ncbi:hypothetical protein OXX80_008612 [Metschnikowia pulcherrima]
MNPEESFLDENVNDDRSWVVTRESVSKGQATPPIIEKWPIHVRSARVNTGAAFSNGMQGSNRKVPESSSSSHMIMSNVVQHPGMNELESMQYQHALDDEFRPHPTRLADGWHGSELSGHANIPNFSGVSSNHAHVHLFPDPSKSGERGPLGSPANDLERNMTSPSMFPELANISLPHHTLPAIESSPEADASCHKQTAPRSKNIYRVGPPFVPTILHQVLFCEATNEQVVPVMTSRIDRGFELGEMGNWIGYKRNYVTLVSTFTFHGWSFDRTMKGKYYVLDDDNNKVRIRYFAFAISVKCNDPEVKVGLVQHTPKRDKGPKYNTPIYPGVPGGSLPDHQTVKLSSNKKNGNRVARMRQIFSFDRREFYRSDNHLNHSEQSLLKAYPCDLLAKVALFERIQFTKSLRVENTGSISKYFTISVELLGIPYCKDGLREHFVLATSDTVPLLVRGRSPSKYPGERTSGFRETNDVRED